MNAPHLEGQASLTSLADLVALIGPPTKPATTVDWTAIEAEVGLTFPDDYKAWADAYADLQLNGYLYVDHPVPAGQETPEDHARIQAEHGY